MMKYLVYGETGQVARELARLPIDAIFLSREKADLSDGRAASDWIAKTAPDAVINAAAWTNVDGAETQQDAAMAVNGAAPGHLARGAKLAGVPFVNISTDYVFDGSGSSPFSPDDPTGPIGVYGATKLAGERAVAEADGTYVNLRTSWVFSAHGSNFLKTMLRLGETRDALNVVGDQVGGPTPAGAIAEACVQIARHLCDHPDASGTYHFSGEADVSWADFARAIFDAAGLAVEVSDIPSSDYPTPAARPLNSRMDCSRTQEVFGIARPDWKAHMNGILKELMVTT